MDGVLLLVRVDADVLLAVDVEVDVAVLLLLLVAVDTDVVLAVGVDVEVDVAVLALNDVEVVDCVLELNEDLVAVLGEVLDAVEGVDGVLLIVAVDTGVVDDDDIPEPAELANSIRITWLTMTAWFATTMSASSDVKKRIVATMGRRANTIGRLSASDTP